MDMIGGWMITTSKRSGECNVPQDLHCSAAVEEVMRSFAQPPKVMVENLMTLYESTEDGMVVSFSASTKS